MAAYVIDPPVAVKWFVPEEYSGPCARLLDGGYDLLGPDTLLFDAGRLITAKARLGELLPDEAREILEALQAVPFIFQPSRDLIEPALTISAGMDLILSHGLGLAMAVHTESRLITATATLYEKVQGTPLAQHVKWVGDLR